MNDTSKPEFESAIFHVVRELLLNRRRVRLNGLGVLAVRHVESTVEETEKGRSLKPPVDEVTFLDEHRSTL